MPTKAVGLGRAARACAFTPEAIMTLTPSAAAATSTRRSLVHMPPDRRVSESHFEADHHAGNAAPCPDAATRYRTAFWCLSRPSRRAAGAAKLDSRPAEAS